VAHVWSVQAYQVMFWPHLRGIHVVCLEGETYAALSTL
jgi:hypothetical protein